LGELANLIKATRIYRTVPTLMVMTVSVAFANHATNQLIYLALVCILIYAAASLHNAIKDKDYYLPNYTSLVILALLIIALVISLNSVASFITGIIWILLGLFYNTTGRHLLLGDATILSITHYALPSFSSSLIVGMDMNFASILAGFMFISFWFIMHSKNLKDTREDAHRGYRTLTTQIHNGKGLTLVLFWLSIIPMALAYFLFNLNKIYVLVWVLILILDILVSYQILKGRAEFALKLTRVIILFFLVGLIVGKAPDLRIVLGASGLCSFYCLSLIKDVIDLVKIKGGAPA